MYDATKQIAIGTTSVHDGHHFEEVLDEHNTGRDVYADKAYPSRRRQEMRDRAEQRPLAFNASEAF